ncbi:condensation domain-containing protein [Dactylosporangium sp. NPDC000521]|uniref:condensation domain-containing protein n=1 Tax=Dactylosporangium sp. NPDC000521 TaxID=3363975 RepID=UPI0036D06725
MIQASAVQHGMWIAVSGTVPTAYHMPLVVTFAHDPDAGLLAKSCAAVAERHALLAVAVAERDGVTYLTRATAPVLRVAGPDEPVEEEATRPFDLGAGPLVRFALFGRVLVVTAHHLVFDGLSKEVLLRDLATFYAGEIPAPLPRSAAEELAAEAARLAGGRAAAEEFWSGRWAEPLPVVVGDHVLTGRDHGAGQVHAFEPPVPDLPGLTRFETLLAAVHALLGGHGNPRVTTGVDVSTREPGASGVGPFATELPVDSRPDPDSPFAEFAAGLRATLRAMYPHRAVPLARAVRRLRPHAAIAPVSVSYRRVGAAPRFDGAPAAVDWLAFAGSVRGDLQLQAVDDGTTVTARLRHSAAAAPVAARFADDLCAVLTRVAAAPDTRLRDLVAPGTSNTTAPPVTVEAQAAAPAPARGGELVEPVLAIWRDVFGDHAIGPDDDLFDLGGDSLTATQIIARMRKTLGIDVDIDTFFDHPTVNGVVDAVSAH